LLTSQLSSIGQKGANRLVGERWILAEDFGLTHPGCEVVEHHADGDTRPGYADLTMKRVGVASEQCSPVHASRVPLRTAGPDKMAGGTAPRDDGSEIGLQRDCWIGLSNDGEMMAESRVS